MPIHRTSNKTNMYVSQAPTKDFPNKKVKKILSTNEKTHRSTYKKFAHTNVSHTNKKSMPPVTVSKQHSLPLNKYIAPNLPSENRDIKVPSSQGQDLLLQNLQSQIGQLESENIAIFRQITKKHSGSSPKVKYEANEHLQTEISQFSSRLASLYKFFNGEMFEVLQSVTEGCHALESKLSLLQNKSNKTKEESQHLPLLEQVAKDLKQLESKFQTNMQTAALNSAQDSKSTFKNKETKHMDSLFEKLKILNFTNNFLKECKAKFSESKSYKEQKLRNLIFAYESENQLLSGKVKNLRSELNRIEHVGQELTNHLIDYLELLKSYALKMRKPLISKQFTNHAIGMSQARVQGTQEKFDASEFNLAANEVAQALKKLVAL